MIFYAPSNMESNMHVSNKESLTQHSEHFSLVFGNLFMAKYFKFFPDTVSYVCLS